MMKASDMKELTNQYVIKYKESGINKASDVMDALETVMITRANDGEDCAVLYIMRLVTSFENDIEKEAYVSYIKSTLLNAGYGVVEYNEKEYSLVVRW